MASFSGIGRVFSYRNARIFYSGSAVAWTGLWMQRVATDWLAWQLTHSPLWVGVIAFCSLGPSMIVSPFAGAIADRLDRVKLTVCSQLFSALHAATLVVLIATGLIRVEYIALLEFLSGISQTISQPARQCLVPGLVPRGDLPAAVALNSLTFNLARCVGPAVSGVMIAAFGVVPSIVCNCIAYLYASLTLPLLKLAPEYRRGHASSNSVWHDAADGLRYVARNRGMGPIFLYAASVGMLLRSVPEMLPPFVAQLFSRGAEGLAILASTMGLAALAGGLAVAMRARLEGLARMSLCAGLLLTFSTAGFVSTHSFYIGVFCMALMGAATTVHGISIQTLLQSACAPGMIGRVLSLWGMVVRAGPAIGALTYGAASEFTGLQVPVAVGCLLACVTFAWAWTRLPVIEKALERSA